MLTNLLYEEEQEEIPEAHKKYLEKITTYTYEWPDNALGATVPKANFTNGWMYANSSDHFSLDIGNVSKQEFEEYKKLCMDAGFSMNNDSTGTYLHAFNEEGYELQLSYDDKDQCMKGFAWQPKEMKQYEWPKTGFATLLPLPKSLYGVVEEDGDRFKAEIYQTSVKDFEAYVDECMKAGFDKEYDKSVNVGYFKGYDENGYELYIRYEENDYYKTMEIRLERP